MTRVGLEDRTREHGMGVPAARIAPINAIANMELREEAILAGIQTPVSINSNCEPHARAEDRKGRPAAGPVKICYYYAAWRVTACFL